MTISALPDTGPLFSLSGVIRGGSTATGRSARGSVDTSQTTLTPEITEARPSVLAATSGTAAIGTQAGPGSSITTAQSVQSATAGRASAPAAGNGDLFSEFKSYATAPTGKSAAAYQEYVKAWGGRVVHGEVEFPPLSIYVD